MGTESLKEGGGAPAEGAPPPGPSFDARLFRSALGRFASGVTIITASYEGQTHGMTANAFVSVSLEPPLVLVSLDNRSYMHKILPSAGHYGVSVLAENQERLSNHFAGRTQEGLHIRFTERENIPLMEGAVAYFAVKVLDVHPAGDHTLYVGRVLHFESRDEKPLLFYSGRYHHVREKIGPTAFPQDEFSLFSIGNVDPPIK